MTDLEPFPNRIEAVWEIGDQLKKIYPFKIKQTPLETDSHRERKLRLTSLWEDFIELRPKGEESPDLIIKVRYLLLEIIDILTIIDVEAAHFVTNILVRWEYDSPQTWYEKGKVMFHLYVSHLYDDFDEICDVFQKVIDLGHESKEFVELPFWAYIFLGNIYLYRILTGEEALEKALKFYNTAYRYSKTEDIDIDEDFIFDNVEVIQQILMNQYPLLLVIYNDTGSLLFQFLYQFVEVMSQDQRFIPNFTALLSAVDDHIQDLFKSPLTNSYLVMQNRLLIISTVYENNSEDWIKVAMIFSYLQQSAFDINIDSTILEKVNEFSRRINEDTIVLNYLTRFNGKRNPEVESSIEELLHDVFSQEI